VSEMVANPLYEALTNALRTVEPLINEIEISIETPYQQFHSGKVWSGPAARRFDGQFAHHRTRVRSSADKVLADLRQTLARTPPKVTAEEATAIAARYGLP
jgi:hypothetical protein